VALAERLGPRTRDALRGLPALVIGGPTAREAERLGFTVAARAAHPTPLALAEAAAAFLDVHLEIQ
jgi:uroporphyrinogen-III synthase